MPTTNKKTKPPVIKNENSRPQMRKNMSFVKKDSARKCCDNRDMLEKQFTVKNQVKRKKSKYNAVNHSVRHLK